MDLAYAYDHNEEDQSINLQNWSNTQFILAAGQQPSSFASQQAVAIEFVQQPSNPFDFQHVQNQASLGFVGGTDIPSQFYNHTVTPHYNRAYPGAAHGTELQLPSRYYNADFPVPSVEVSNFVGSTEFIPIKSRSAPPFCRSSALDRISTPSTVYDYQEEELVQERRGRIYMTPNAEANARAHGKIQVQRRSQSEEAEVDMDDDRDLTPPIGNRVASKFIPQATEFQASTVEHDQSVKAPGTAQSSGTGKKRRAPSTLNAAITYRKRIRLRHSHRNPSGVKDNLTKDEALQLMEDLKILHGEESSNLENVSFARFRRFQDVRLQDQSSNRPFARSSSVGFESPIRSNSDVAASFSNGHRLSTRHPTVTYPDGPVRVRDTTVGAIEHQNSNAWNDLGGNYIRSTRDGSILSKINGSVFQGYVADPQAFQTQDSLIHSTRNIQDVRPASFHDRNGSTRDNENTGGRSSAMMLAPESNSRRQFQAPSTGLLNNKIAAPTSRSKKAQSAGQRQFTAEQAEVFSIANLTKFVGPQNGQNTGSSTGPARQRAPRYSAAVMRNRELAPPQIGRPWPYGLIMAPPFTNSAGVKAVDYYMKREHGGRPRKNDSNETPTEAAARNVNMENKRASRDRDSVVKGLMEVRSLFLSKLQKHGAKRFQSYMRTSKFPQTLPAPRTTNNCYVDERNIPAMVDARLATGQFSSRLDGYHVSRDDNTTSGSQNGVLQASDSQTGQYGSNTSYVPYDAVLPPIRPRLTIDTQDGTVRTPVKRRGSNATSRGRARGQGRGKGGGRSLTTIPRTPQFSPLTPGGSDVERIDESSREHEGVRVSQDETEDREDDDGEAEEEQA